MTEQLEVAVKSGRVDVVKGFLSTLTEHKTQENSDLQKKILTSACFNGESLLHMASREDQFDIVRTLLSSGADPTVRNVDGKFAFEISASDKTCSVYRESLLQAASQSNITQVEQLHNSGVGVNFIDTAESANTPLHWAASFAEVQMVQCLCALGANVHAVNTVGCTPLHEAVSRGNHDIVHCLLQYGSDPALQISKGKFAGMTCYEMAEGKPEVLDVLNNPPAQLEIKPKQEDTLSPLTVCKPKLSLPNGSALKSTDNDISPQLMSPVFKRNPVPDLSMTAPQVVTEEKLNHLWPQPRRLEQREGPPFCLNHSFIPVMISTATGSASREIKKKWLLYRDKFADMNLTLVMEPLTPLCNQEDPHIVCNVSQRLCPRAQSYQLHVLNNQIRLLCHDLSTLHHAISTILQLFSIYTDGKTKAINVPQLWIDDWPDLPYRGALMDISQGRVPNIETFQETIIILSSMKINQVYVYVRFRPLEQVLWQICYSIDELCDLDEFCHDYGVELVPVLEVAPTVQYQDVPALYAGFQEFLACFNYTQFVSVGPRLSSFLLDVDDQDIAVSDIHTMLPLRANQTVQLCGYPLHDLELDLLRQIPPHLVFNEYGVQATHNYSETCKPLTKNGISFMVCPGTAAWTSLAGCPEAAVTTVYNAVKCAISEGALGLLVCNWSGKGHANHLPFSWPGFLIGAGLSWNSQCHFEYCLSNLEDLMNEHVFQAEQGIVGHAIVELGRAETYLLRCARCQTGEDCSDLPADNGSLLYKLLLEPDNASIENLNLDMMQKVTRHIRKCQTELKSAVVHCRQGDSILAELNHTCDLMLLAVKIGRALIMAGRNPGNQAGRSPSNQAGCDVVNLGISNLPPTAKTDLANRLLELVDVYKGLWMKRYLEHGLKYSQASLQVVLKQFIPEGDPRSQQQEEHV